METAVQSRTRREQHNLALLGDAAVEGVVELGRRTMKLKEVRAWQVGQTTIIDKLAGEAFTLRINGQPFAEGEAVAVTETMALRLTRLYEVCQEVAP